MQSFWNNQIVLAKSAWEQRLCFSHSFKTASVIPLQRLQPQIQLQKKVESGTSVHMSLSWVPGIDPGYMWERVSYLFLELVCGEQCNN